ncbi:MAG: ribonuclease D, partial [Acidobacteria bacterium]
MSIHTSDTGTAPVPSARDTSAAPVSAAGWIRRPDELAALVERLQAGSEVALDTESNSLHHFPERVCLIQLADPAGGVFLVDPLALADLSPFAPCLADPEVVKVFHGATYDLSSLKRDFGFRFARIFDTMVAAQFLGIAELGLSALLQRYFGISPTRSRQKDDWTARPLTPEQEAYAAEDVRHLLALRRQLLGELVARGREAWVEEECEALAELPAAERVFDPDDAFRVKGAGALDRR